MTRGPFRARRLCAAAAAFCAAEASGKPAILRLAIDPEAITPGTTLAKIRAKALEEKK